MSFVELLLPGLGAGAVAVLVTLAIERWGGRIGGLLGTLPSTIVPAAWGIWAHAASPDEFRAAMFGVPPGMLINAVFLWLWRVVPEHLPRWPLAARLVAMATISLASWSALALLLVIGLDAAGPTTTQRAALGVLGLAVLVGAGVLASRRPKHAPRGTRRVSPLVLLGRGGTALVAVSLAVFISSTGHPLAAGVASVFPAIFLTTMVSLWLSQGEAVPAGAVAPMMLGSSSVAGFALLAAWTLPPWGPAIGVVTSWIGAALGVTLPAFLWLRARAARAQ